MNHKATYLQLLEVRSWALSKETISSAKSVYFTCISITLHLLYGLAPRASKMNQMVPYDWLPEQARWSHHTRSGLPAVSRKKHFPESHIINPLLTKFVRSRWLDISLILSLRVHGLKLRLGPYTRKKELSLANIQPSWHHTWSMTHIYYNQRTSLPPKKKLIQLRFNFFSYTINRPGWKR